MKIRINVEAIIKGKKRCIFVLSVCTTAIVFLYAYCFPHQGHLPLFPLINTGNITVKLSKPL